MFKKIAIISAFTPNNLTAGQSLTQNLIEKLLGKNYIIDLYIIEHKDENVLLNHENLNIIKLKVTKIERIINILLGIFFLINPIFSNRFNIFRAYKLSKMIKEKNYDVVIYNFSQVFLYYLFNRRSRSIFIIHDVIYQLFSRRKGFINKLFKYVSYIDEKVFFNFAKGEFVLLNEKDKNLINNLYGVKGHVGFVILDKKIFELDIDKIEIENTITLFGAWKRKENLQTFLYFFKNIYPHLNNQFQINILGTGISEDMVNFVKNLRNVKIIGFVENPYLYLAKSKVLFALLFEGAGVKVKVLEALASGTYVVGNEITFEGINIDKGKILCENESECIRMINEAYNIGRKEKKEIRLSFLEYYNSLKKLDEIVQDIIEGSIK
jgi:glycosyltransferase involved in cell wall biosynthesis